MSRPTVRLVLLLLLALLLPVRGVLAATMPCDPPPATHQQAGHEHHQLHQQHDEAAQDDAHKCKHCAACMFSPMPGADPALPDAPALEAQQFPALSAAAPQFLAAGPERPPRSL